LGNENSIFLIVFMGDIMDRLESVNILNINDELKEKVRQWRNKEKIRKL